MGFFLESTRNLKEGKQSLNIFFDGIVMLSWRSCGSGSPAWLDGMYGFPWVLLEKRCAKLLAGHLLLQFSSVKIKITESLWVNQWWTWSDERGVC